MNLWLAVAIAFAVALALTVKPRRYVAHPEIYCVDPAQPEVPETGYCEFKLRDA